MQKAVPCKALYKSHKDFIARERPEGHSEGLEREQKHVQNFGRTV
jgi:hypothetical protein